MISGETIMCKVKTLHDNWGRRTKDIWGGGNVNELLGRACSTYGGEEKRCMQGFGGES